MPRFLRLVVCLILGFTATQAVFGQYVVLAAYKGKFWPVRAASGRRAVIEVDGKRVVITSHDEVALRPVEEYVPLFIAVRGMQAEDEDARVVGTGAVLASSLDIQADFSAAYRLDDVFLVLELNFKDGTKTLYLHQVGRIEPNEPTLVRLAPPTLRSLGSFQYTLHLFVGGREVLHSEMPLAAREGALDRMVAKRNAGRVDANPQLFLGTPPEFPRQLEKSKTTGQVIVRVHILPNGAVADPSVVKASAPEFGEAALAAVRQWRFLPKMKGGQPVAAVVDVPLDFTPPAKS